MFHTKYHFWCFEWQHDWHAIGIRWMWRWIHRKRYRVGFQFYKCHIPVGRKYAHVKQTRKTTYFMGQPWKGQSILEQQPSAKIWWVWVKLWAAPRRKGRNKLGLRRRGLFWVEISGKVECWGQMWHITERTEGTMWRSCVAVPTLVESWCGGVNERRPPGRGGWWAIGEDVAGHRSGLAHWWPWPQEEGLVLDLSSTGKI